MLNKAQRVLSQLSPHEHSWSRQSLSSGLERSVCDRCGGVQILDIGLACVAKPRPASFGTSGKRTTPRDPPKTCRSHFSMHTVVAVELLTNPFV
jgi:hypothetical protein